MVEALKVDSKLDVTMYEKDEKTLLEKAHNTIVLCLLDKMLSQVSKEKIAVRPWMKLERLYITKSFVKQALYSYKTSSEKDI